MHHLRYNLHFRLLVCLMQSHCLSYLCQKAALILQKLCVSPAAIFNLNNQDKLLYQCGATSKDMCAKFQFNEVGKINISSFDYMRVYVIKAV